MWSAPAQMAAKSPDSRGRISSLSISLWLECGASCYTYKTIRGLSRMDFILILGMLDIFKSIFVQTCQHMSGEKGGEEKRHPKMFRSLASLGRIGIFHSFFFTFFFTVLFFSSLSPFFSFSPFFLFFSLVEAPRHLLLKQ